MSRPSDLWFRQSNGYWYSTINGRQVKLEQDETKSRTQLEKILRGQQELTHPWRHGR